MNCVQNTWTFAKDFPIGKAQDAIATSVQKRRASSIVYDVTVLAVLFAVELNDQLGPMAGEVGDVGTDGHLAAEMQPSLFESAQHQPQSALGVGLVFAQMSCEGV